MPIDNIINVPDSRPNVAIGIDLPLFSSYGSSFKQNYISLDQASANARNLLLTREGERVMQPNFGCGLYALLFEPITDEVINNFKLRVKDQFEYWLPYIFINRFEMAAGDNLQKNTLNVYMVISLKNNQFDTKTITLELVGNQI